MKLANDWFKSKVLWAATGPALVGAWQAYQHGTPWWQAILIGAAGTGLFGLRDAIARHQEELNTVVRLLMGLQQLTQTQTGALATQTEALTAQQTAHQDERMSTIRASSEAQKASADASREAVGALQDTRQMLRGRNPAQVLKAIGEEALEHIISHVQAEAAGRIGAAIDARLLGGAGAAGEGGAGGASGPEDAEPEDGEADADERVGEQGGLLQGATGREG